MRDVVVHPCRNQFSYVKEVQCAGLRPNQWGVKIHDNGQIRERSQGKCSLRQLVIARLHGSDKTLHTELLQKVEVVQCTGLRPSQRDAKIHDSEPIRERS